MEQPQDEMGLAKGAAVVVSDAGSAHAGRTGTLIRAGRKNALVLFDGESEPRHLRPDELSAAPPKEGRVRRGSIPDVQEGGADAAKPKGVYHCRVCGLPKRGHTCQGQRPGQR